MASSGVAQIVSKFRNRSADDLNQCLINLCRLMSSFSTIDKQTEPVVIALRDLYLMLQLSGRADRKIPENVTTLFLAALQDLKVIHPQLLTALVACLAQLCPTSVIKIDVKALESVDTGRIPVFLHLLRQQDLPKEFGYSSCVQMVKYLNDAVAGPSTKTAVLAFLVNQFLSEADAVFFKDCYEVVSWSMANWLVNASTFDEAQQEKSKRTVKSVTLLSVTEMDGSTPSETFTALSLARSYAEDQRMNISSFMLLYDMLLTSSLRDQMKERLDNGLEMPLATLQGRVKAENLEEIAFGYCLRLLKQAEVRPLKSSYDCELQDVVLSEAIRIMNYLCTRNPKLIRKAFRSIVDVNDRAMRKIHNMQVILHTFHFLLLHGDGANFEIDNMCHFLCCDFIPGSALLDNIFTSEFVALLRDNRHLLTNKTKMFSRYFPGILKALAWNPRANMHLFVDLIPCFVNASTHLEIFHSLIDLPCVSAVLEISIHGENSFLSTVRQLASDRTKDPRLRYFFDFFLRNEGGRNEVAEHVTDFHKSLADLSGHPRVLFCSQAVSALLSIYFSSVVAIRLTLEQWTKLANAVLDRMNSLFACYANQSITQMVMADGFTLILSKNPSLLAIIDDKIGDYITANHFMHVTFLTSLVWCIGESVSWNFNADHPKSVSKLFEAVECLTYDIIKTQSKNLVYNPQEWSMELLQTSLTTMTRLGALSHDLTRRTVICLNNVIKKTREYPDQQRFHIVEQIDSLIKLLELPSVSEIVMNLSVSPEPEVLEAIKRLKSVAEEYSELSAAQSP